MDPQQLRYFLALAREGSFVKAAEAQDIAQPTLSQQVKKLENDLGVALFDRLGRGVRLTAYGRALLPHAELMLRQSQEARKAIEALQSERGGELNVGVIPTILPYAMAELMAEFQRANPKVRLGIHEQTTEKLIEGLRLGALDMAVLALPLKQPEIICCELLREPLLAALPAGHQLARQGSITLKSLADQRMLLLREGHCLRDDVLTACTRARAAFTNSFDSDHLGSIFAMVAAGFGVSLVPALAAQQAPGCKLLPVEPRVFRRVGYAIAAGHTPLPVQKHFTAFLKKQCAAQAKLWQ